MCFDLGKKVKEKIAALEFEHGLENELTKQINAMTFATYMYMFTAFLVFVAVLLSSPLMLILIGLASLLWAIHLSSLRLETQSSIQYHVLKREIQKLQKGGEFNGKKNIRRRNR